MNFEAQRIKMVDNQIRPTDVTSHSILSAFLTVPREAFVPDAKALLAYIDTDIALAPGRYLMEPSPLAKLLQLAEIKPTDRVLEVGAATGYATAILSRVAASVVGLESDAALVATARETLARLGYAADLVEGDLEKGVPAKAPFDVIFVNGAVEFVPDALVAQLAEGGRLVAVIGEGNASRARLFLKELGIVSERVAFNTAVRPLPGFRLAREFVF
ncbi:protein-L-isoaspartate O-methyltransferase family protein [Ensifer soli]|uniref:protein-L-isoaspartate O-methyltransferase family protein n=1 Tax=Ciceribacter sp. sgz301302 TaxID=3342379 RepID=UPI0035B9A978